MKLNVGDRVIVISYDSPGTIIEIDDIDAPEVIVVCVEMDNPEEFASIELNMTQQELKRGLESGKRPSVKMYTDANDVKKISGGSHEPEWKDIWDESAN